MPLPFYDKFDIGRLMGGGIYLLSPGTGILIGGGGSVLLLFNVLFIGGTGIFIGGICMLFY